MFPRNFSFPLNLLPRDFGNVHANLDALEELDKSLDGLEFNYRLVHNVPTFGGPHVFEINNDSTTTMMEKRLPVTHG